MTAHRQAGFTLIEILVALLMSSIIFIAIYTTSEKQQDVYVKQDQVVGMQDNLRAAMLLMTREIRMAGYNPTGSAGAGVTAAAAGSLEFTMDSDGNGDTAGTDEDITYLLYTADGINKLGRKSPTQTMPVAENIINLEFYYTMSDGSQTLAPATLSDIRAVQITVLARTANTQGDLTATPTMTTPGGQTWQMPDNFLWRSESTTVLCRNLGL